MPGTRLETEISGLAYGGYGVAKGSFGVVFVHRGVPGDRAKVNITRGKKKYGSGEIETLIKPSASRTNPGCVAFEQGCGGCQWLHMQYPVQTEWKEKIVRDTIKRIGGLSCKVLPVIAMQKPWNYRNKLSLQVRPTERLCGFMKENSHDILGFSDCRCAMGPGFGAYTWLSASVKTETVPVEISQVHVRSNREGRFGVCVYADIRPESKKAVGDMRNFAEKLMRENENCCGVGVSARGKYINLCGEAHIEIKMGNIIHLIPHNGFFQTSYSQAETLTGLVKRFLSLSKSDTLLDLYSGSGLFALDLAASCSRVLGIENNSSSIQYAQKNAGLNNLNNCRFKSSDAADALKREKSGDWSCAVLDPPRAGCGPELLRELCRIAPSRIAYVSCAPDTLARDLKMLSEQGYSLEYIQPVDMFPHTWHVEVVAGLKHSGTT